MPMTGFFCQDEYLAKLSKFTDEEVGKLFRALMEYHISGAVADLDIRGETAFDFIREDIDRAEEAYSKKCKQASENRRKGITLDVTDDNASQRPSTPVNGGDNNNINKRNIKENKKENKVKEPENIVPLKRFIPPTVDDVALYCCERKNHVNAQKFFDYYSSNGWKVGKNPMKDWKAAVRTWERSEITERDYQYERETSGLPY